MERESKIILKLYINSGTVANKLGCLMDIGFTDGDRSIGKVTVSQEVKSLGMRWSGRGPHGRMMNERHGLTTRSALGLFFLPKRWERSQRTPTPPCTPIGRKQWSLGRNVFQGEPQRSWQTRQKESSVQKRVEDGEGFPGWFLRAQCEGLGVGRKSEIASDSAIWF